MTTCFKCNGSGLKPCKSSQLHLKCPCPVCKGNGRLESNRDRLITNNYRPFKEIESHIDISYLNNLEADVILTSLCGTLFIQQIEFGHKVTTDDYICAAGAVQHFRDSSLPDPAKFLDLGTGLGSVLMLVTAGLDLNSKSLIHGIEIQDRHVNLARKSLALNEIIATIFHSDLRDFSPATTYDLITATPPYFPAISGSLPINPNRAQCAFELNGDINDYLLLASKCLSKTVNARVVVANGGSVDRTITAGFNMGFQCLERIDVHGKTGKGVIFSVYVFKWSDDDVAVKEDVKDLYIRDFDGEFTADYQQLVDLVLKRRQGLE
jgi:tRNA1Val (adenine37-N6)-methyltransferase